MTTIFFSDKPYSFWRGPAWCFYDFVKAICISNLITEEVKQRVVSDSYNKCLLLSDGFTRLEIDTMYFILDAEFSYIRRVDDDNIASDTYLKQLGHLLCIWRAFYE